MTTDYREIGSELGELLNSKQRAYGNVFGVTPAIIELLFPGGIPVTAYKDVLALVRVLDKVGRICTAAGRADPSGESPWSDIAGYAMLMLRRKERSPSNEWALTWSSPAIRRAFIDSVFPTRELAEARHAEMAAKQPRLTWRVCRVDEVSK